MTIFSRKYQVYIRKWPRKQIETRNWPFWLRNDHFRQKTTFYKTMGEMSKGCEIRSFDLLEMNF